MATTKSTPRPKSPSKKSTETIAVNQPIVQKRTMEITIVGDTPLIVNAFGPKARQQMIDDQTKPPSSGPSPRKKLAPRVPEEEYEDAKYRLPDGRDAFPASALKAAIVGAASMFGRDVAKINLKKGVFIVGEGPEQLIPLDYETVEMRTDMVRIGKFPNKTTTPRWRPQYQDWSLRLEIEFVPAIVSADTLVALVNAAGFGGIGEWRPSAPENNTGTYGRFHPVLADMEIYTPASSQLEMIMDKARELEGNLVTAGA